MSRSATHIPPLIRRTRTETELERVTARAQHVITSPQNGQTYEQLAKAAMIPVVTTKRLVRRLHEEGSVQRVGTGRKGDPFQFKRNESQPNVIPFPIRKP
jgi:transposase